MRRFYRTLFSRELDNVYLANIFFSFHACLLLYVNSPFLARVVSDRTIAALYIAGSLLNIVFMVYAPRVLATLGVRDFSLTIVLIEAVGVIGMLTTTNPVYTGMYFVLHLATILLLSYVLDLFLERAIRSELYTGRIRSIFLTISNVILVASPLVVSIIVSRSHSFVPIYMFAAMLLVPLFCIVGLDLPKTGIGNKHVSVIHGIKTVWRTHHLRGVTLARLCLEFFYGWMVVYMALYLHNKIGFSWPDIGILFSIMLVPFVLFELPLGTISDHHANEKEIMIIGFGITAVAVALIPTLTTPVFLQWAVLLFATRVGASFIEMGSESYFFKHVNAHDSDTVSLFRLTRPLGFILAPLMVSTLLPHVQFDNSFFVLALIVLLGLVPTLWLQEKR